MPLYVLMPLLILIVYKIALYSAYNAVDWLSSGENKYPIQIVDSSCRSKFGCNHWYLI